MNRRLIYYYIGAVILTAAWLMFVYRPLDARQYAGEAKIQELTTRLQSYQHTVADLPALLKAQNALLSSKQAIESNLFAKKDILELFHDIDKQVRQHNLVLAEIIPPVHELLQLNDLSRNPDDPIFLNISLVLRGEYIQFARYVKTLEGESYFRGINQCSIQTTRKDKSRGNVEAVYTIGFKALLGNLMVPS
jgi:Tfp pilus assembly protein PilO